MTPQQLEQASEEAKKQGIDYSTTVDGKGMTFLYFGDDSESDGFAKKIHAIADAAGFKLRDIYQTRSDLIEWQDYNISAIAGTGGQNWLQGSAPGSSSLFRRAVDHVIVPYAKAVGAEGYRLSPARFAEQFGLSDEQRGIIEDALEAT